MSTSGAGERRDDASARRPAGLEARLADALVTRLVESRFSEALMEQVLAALTESKDVERLVVHLLGQPGVNGAVDAVVDRQVGRVIPDLRESEAVRDLIRDQADAYLRHLAEHPEGVERLVVDLLQRPDVNRTVDALVDRQVERVLRELPRSEAVRALVREQADAYLRHVAAHPEVVEGLVRDQVDRYLRYLTEHPEPVRQLIQDQSRGMLRDVQATASARALVADDVVDGWLGRARGTTAERYAGIVSRGIGRALDVALLAASIAGGSWLVQQFFGIDPGHCAPDAAWWNVRAQVCRFFPYVVPLAGLIVPPLYGVVFFVATGQTPGMGMMGLRLRREDGRSVRLRQALKRVATFYVTVGLGSLLIPFTARRRALHDIVAGTVVEYDWGDHAKDVERAVAQVRSADA